MALLSDYGVINEGELFDYRIYHKAIDTLCGLMLFKIIEDEITSSGITIMGFEKSLWTKKQKGYVRLEHISNYQPNTIHFRYDDGQRLPPFSDVLIGFEFWSEYGSMYWHEQFHTYQLGQPRKEVLSYGMLMLNVQRQLDAWTKASIENLQSDWTSASTNSTLKMCRNFIDIFSRIKEKITVFDKYKLHSNQPV